MSFSCLKNVARCGMVKVSPSSVLVSKLRRPCVVREVHTSGAPHAAVSQQNTKPDWNRAVSEAEKIVGYPTSFLSLRWVLSDEIANVALHLRKLVGSNHPLLKTAKNLIYNGKNNMQAWGLIVLLVSKAAGHSPEIPDMEQDKAAGVLHSQRALAEVTEMIRTSHLVHKGLVNMNAPQVGPGDPDDMMFGNKIALLGGDYLLANSCSELANLRKEYKGKVKVLVTMSGSPLVWAEGSKPTYMATTTFSRFFRYVVGLLFNEPLLIVQQPDAVFEKFLRHSHT